MTSSQNKRLCAVTNGFPLVGCPTIFIMESTNYRCCDPAAVLSRGCALPARREHVGLAPCRRAARVRRHAVSIPHRELCPSRRFASTPAARRSPIVRPQRMAGSTDRAAASGDSLKGSCGPSARARDGPVPVLAPGPADGREESSAAGHVASH